MEINIEKESNAYRNLQNIWTESVITKLCKFDPLKFNAEENNTSDNFGAQKSFCFV